jgi:transcriptional regulator with XRE-family HTH domain
MDVKQIRRGNMIALIAQHPTQAAFARKVGTDPAYISQILSAKTKAEVGNELARAIESACGLPHGWMDHEPNANARDEQNADVIQDFARVYAAITDDGRAFLRNSIMAAEKAYRPDDIAFLRSRNAS